MIPATSRGQWNTDVSQHGEAMSRLPSQDSVGAHSYPPSSSYDEASSARMYSHIVQKPFYISSTRSETSGRSNSPDDFTLYTSAQNQMELQNYDHFSCPVAEDFHGSQNIYHGEDLKLDYSSNVAGSSYNMFAATTEEIFAPMAAVHGPVTRDSLLYNSSIDSPVWDGRTFPDSPAPTLEEDWTLPLHMASPSSSPLQYSPSLKSVSPTYTQDIPDLPPYTTGDRVIKKPIGPRPSKVASDMARNCLPGSSQTAEESMGFVPRASIDIDNTVRDHPYYQNVTVHADGLYHCPWEGKEGCAHKAEKLKCNYE